MCSQWASEDNGRGGARYVRGLVAGDRHRLSRIRRAPGQDRRDTDVESVGNRMWVILAERDWAKWLGEEPTTEEELMGLLQPCLDKAFRLTRGRQICWTKIWLVSKTVGNVKNKGRNLIEPLALLVRLFQERRCPRKWLGDLLRWHLLRVSLDDFQSTSIELQYRVISTTHAVCVPELDAARFWIQGIQNDFLAVSPSGMRQRFMLNLKISCSTLDRNFSSCCSLVANGKAPSLSIGSFYSRRRLDDESWLRQEFLISLFSRGCFSQFCRGFNL